nr:hypothetical protein [Tanacetum cinerariifolium]
MSVVRQDIGRGIGLKASRKLKPGALSLYVGNGQREAVEAIGIFYLCIPSGLEIILNKCHYAPSITRGVTSVSYLYEYGFVNHFVNNTIQVFRNNMVYFSVVSRDGIFEIDLFNSYTNESYIYAVNNKRAKLDLDSDLLWHCRLRHISKKRIEKLPHDRLLNSTDLRAFEKYVFCMSGKMARPEKWLNAMNVEIQSMKDNEVWVLVELPPNGKTVGSKWLFKKKTDIDGVETFSTVADIRAIRILIAIAAYYGYEIWKMDVKTAFLNGYLNEEVYIEQHEGEDAYILGIKIYRDRSWRLIGLCQSAYIEKNLKVILHGEFQAWKYPHAKKLKLSKSRGASMPAELKRMQNVPYALAMGSIMYAVRCTRLDVAFTQNVTSQFQQNLEAEYIAASKEAV